MVMELGGRSVADGTPVPPAIDGRGPGMDAKEVVMWSNPQTSFLL